jgi:hypothetical protein
MCLIKKKYKNEDMLLTDASLFELDTAMLHHLMVLYVEQLIDFVFSSTVANRTFLYLNTKKISIY